MTEKDKIYKKSGFDLIMEDNNYTMKNVV